MTFLNPAFLWALSAIAIPVLIHLFNFRKYKRVYFTNVKFLKELQIESKSRSRLRELLVLMFRCLTIACLVFAFSQPVLRKPGDKTAIGGPRTISIYIDNSFSMQNIGSRGPLLEMAKQKARDIVKAHGLQDKFQIISNEMEGRDQRLSSRDEALSRIDEIRITSAIRKLKEVLIRQMDALHNSKSGNKKIYLISDAQKTTFNLKALNECDSIPVYLVPVTSNLINNVYVDSCWFSSPIQQKGFIQTLYARLVNGGENPVESGSAKLTLNNAQVALSNYSIAPHTKTELKFTFECRESGFNFGSVKINDYPVNFDDELFFAFNSHPKLGIYLIEGKDTKSNEALESLFNNDSIFSLFKSSDKMINYASFRNKDMIVLNGLSDLGSGLLIELTRFSQRGGALVIVPPSEAISGYSSQVMQQLRLPGFVALDSSNQSVDKINTASGFYNGVFEKEQEGLNLPHIRWHYQLNTTSRSDFENLLNLTNRDPFLVATRNASSPCFLFTSSFEESSGNFLKHALFVPTFYRMAFLSQKEQPLFYQVRTNSQLQIKPVEGMNEAPPHLVKPGTETDLIPNVRKTENGWSLFTNELVVDPGYYELRQGKSVIQPMAFNYKREESELSCYSSNEIEDFLLTSGNKNVQVFSSNDEDFREQLIHGAEIKSLWKLFIILALGFITAELVVLRILK